MNTCGRFIVGLIPAVVVVCAAHVVCSPARAAGWLKPGAEHPVISELATRTRDRAAHGLGDSGVPEVDDLARVAARSLDAIATGDWRELHRVATEKGAVRHPSRLEAMRAQLKGRPPEVVPPNVDIMTDTEVIAENNKFCRPLVRVDVDSVAVTSIGKKTPFDAFNSVVQGEASRTEMRRRHAGEPGLAVNFLHVPEDLAHNRGGALTDAVIVEFEGESVRGPLMVCVVYYYNAQTGWLPGGMVVVGSKMGMPR